MQVDTWMSLGDGKTVPDEWVRVSAILKSGVQIATAHTAQRIDEANRRHEC